MKDYVIKQGRFFWRADSKGYTEHIGQAGLYTAEHAFSIQHNRREPLDIALPLIGFHDELLNRKKALVEELSMIDEKLSIIEVKHMRARR